MRYFNVDLELPLQVEKVLFISEEGSLNEVNVEIVWVRLAH